MEMGGNRNVESHSRTSLLWGSVPLFSALRMASPDTIMLLIVDYHAAIRGGGAGPPWPLSTPLTGRP